MLKTKTYKTVLILEDKTVYHGWSFNEQCNANGEVVFNTGMTGYQEIITDPSYAGQIITFTYPEIGNTGINRKDHESRQPFIKGIIAKNLCSHSSNWREEETLISYLINHSIAHIYGIDTRALTKHLRSSGTMNGYISTKIEDMEKLFTKLEDNLISQDNEIIQKVSSQNTEQFKNIQAYQPKYIYNISPVQYKPMRIIIIDFGVKYNIIRSVQAISENINTHIVPADTSIQSILSLQPDGILLSNGPGDPSVVHYAIETVKELLKYNIPIFGICMGYQIICLALGLKTFKLKFGHRGLNHPVGFNQSISISSQNHGFAVKTAKNKDHNIVIYEHNYNDNTLASIVHRQYPCFAVQYHPEASPGPRDTANLFEHFIKIISVFQKYPTFKQLYK
uniref:Carbamoyl phosphate synthase small chain n=1 Tax=Titanophycus setchellii TaxID=940129 RepID=A0A1G4NY26_9FLOR|nr:Carbamoyl phosphate synthase small subunit [Titanophycus setchellii]SCW23514.1 Carbamoyl phosphate synthase small subunit [Titanophycus setchellii]